MFFKRATLIAIVLFSSSLASAQESEGPPPPTSMTPQAGDANAPLSPEEVKAYNPRFAKKAASFLKNFGSRAVKRARRGIVVGPYVGASGIKFLGGGDFDYQGTVGLGLIKFKTPILPDTGAMADVLVSAAKNLFWKKVRSDLGLGGPITKADLDELADKIWQDIVDELKMKRTNHSLNKPSFALRANATYTSSAEAWETSITGSFGIGRFLFSTGGAIVIVPQFAFFIPAEISFPYAFGSGMRSNVGELYLRYDISAYDRDTRKDRVTIGTRFTLDLL